MTTKREYEALLRSDLASFIHKVFLTVVPGVSFIPGWHINAIAFELETVVRGERNRLVITMPPRHLKSIAVSVALPAWLLGHDPTRRIVCVSYSQKLANRHAFDTRTVMESDWYRELFPDTRLHGQKNALNEYWTTHGGYRMATSVGGSLTGNGGDTIIIDDPHKANEVESETQRCAVIEWYRSTLLSRLNNKSTGVIILVQQRLHEADLAGHVLESGKWRHLNLPAIAEEDEWIEVGPGEDDWHFRAEGALLHPERETMEALEELRNELGSIVFNAQYQQRPSPLEGGIIKWSWFRTYDRLPDRGEVKFIVQSWDTAQTADNGGDWSVCTTWWVIGPYYFLVDVERFRAEFPVVLRRVVRSAHEHDADSVVIESVGAGMGLYQQAREKLGTKVRDTKPRDDKATRAVQECAVIEGGYVHIPKEAPWLSEFRHEIINFPNGKHDDQVDSLTQFLHCMRTWVYFRCKSGQPTLTTRTTLVGAREHYTTEQILNCPYQ